MTVPGYDYPAFLHAVIIRRGHGCWVGKLLRARREHWLRSRAPGAAMPWDLDPGLLLCQGELDAHHLISKQRLKREDASRRHWIAPLDPRELEPFDLAVALMDPRVGVICCRRHHDTLERRVVVPLRSELPEGVEGFAAEVGMVWSLERDYGAVESEAA